MYLLKPTYFYWIMLVFGFLSFNKTGYTQGPPIFTDSPILLGLEGRGVRTFSKYIVKENAQIYIHPIIVPLNITAKLVLGGIVPFVKKNPDNLESQSGFGDVSIFAKYVVVQKDKTAKTFRVALKALGTFPTGKTNTEPPISLNAYQSYVGIVTGYITTKYGLYGELGYKVVSKGLPNNLVYNIAIGYPLLPVTYPAKQINLNMGLNGNSSIENDQTTILASPGVQYIAGRRFLVEGGVQFPLIQNLPKENRIKVIYTFGIRVLIF